MKKSMLRLLLFLSFTLPVFAQNLTISGYVIDNKSEETLIGANVLVIGTNQGAATDMNGFFRITGISPGYFKLRITYIGYKEKIIEVTLFSKSVILDDIALEPKAIELETLVVKGKASEVMDHEIETSYRDITPKAIQRIPAINGDLFKALKYLPGIESIDPLTPLYSVRGGDPGGNLILLDGVTIYNPYHCVSSTSLFNPYAIKDVNMMVGGFGAEYGGRTSSVLYISTREGNSKEFHGEIEPGLTSSRMVVEFPFSKNATMMISVRGYYDLVTQFLLYSPAYLFDTNISINWKINKRNRLSVRYFNSYDYNNLNFSEFYTYLSNTFEEEMFENYDLTYKNRWSNQAVTGILKSVINPRVYLKTQVSGSFFFSNNISKFDFEYFDEENDKNYKLFYRTDISNKIRDLSVKLILSAKLNSSNTVLLGTEYSNYYFGNDLKINYFSEGEAVREPHLFAHFIQDKIKYGNFMLRAGIRVSKFGSSDKWYTEPRINGSYELPYGVKFKFAWGRYYQFIPSINSQEYELSQFLDYYYPLQDKDPCTSIHQIVGFDKSFFNNMMFSFDVYYKDIKKVYTFDYNLSESEIYGFSDKIKAGAGKSYGIEMLWKGSWRNFSGWVSYGIGRTTRSYPHIMNEKSFLYDYDRTHRFKAMITHQINPLLSYTGTLRILSGVPKTIESMIKSYYYYDHDSNDYSSFPIFVTESKNNARLPLYIRLDLGIKKRLTTGFGAELAQFLGADKSYLNVTFGNLLFFWRNVIWYFPISEKKLYGFGMNYLPSFNMGYTVKF